MEWIWTEQNSRKLLLQITSNGDNPNMYPSTSWF